MPTRIKICGITRAEDALAACEAQGAEWYIVEHDKPTDPLAAAQASLDKLAGLLAPLRK